jgi:hypothetical protein
VSELPSSSSATGSPTSGSSAATFTGAGPSILVPGWGLILVVSLAGLW